MVKNVIKEDLSDEIERWQTHLDLKDRAILSIFEEMVDMNSKNIIETCYERLEVQDSIANKLENELMVTAVKETIDESMIEIKEY